MKTVETLMYYHRMSVVAWFPTRISNNSFCIWYGDCLSIFCKHIKNYPIKRSKMVTIKLKLRKFYGSSQIYNQMATLPISLKYAYNGSTFFNKKKKL